LKRRAMTMDRTTKVLYGLAVVGALSAARSLLGEGFAANAVWLGALTAFTWPLLWSRGPAGLDWALILLGAVGGSLFMLLIRGGLIAALGVSYGLVASSLIVVATLGTIALLVQKVGRIRRPSG